MSNCHAFTKMSTVRFVQLHFSLVYLFLEGIKKPELYNLHTTRYDEQNDSYRIYNSYGALDGGSSMSHVDFKK